MVKPDGLALCCYWSKDRPLLRLLGELAWPSAMFVSGPSDFLNKESLVYMKNLDQAAHPSFCQKWLSMLSSLRVNAQMLWVARSLSGIAQIWLVSLKLLGLSKVSLPRRFVPSCSP